RSAARPSRPVPSVVEGSADGLAWLAVALAGEAQDGGTIDEAIHHGDSHRLRREEVLPVGKAGIGGEDDGAFALPSRDHAEEIGRRLEVEGFVGELLELEDLRFDGGGSCGRCCSWS